MNTTIIIKEISIGVVEDAFLFEVWNIYTFNNTFNTIVLNFMNFINNYLIIFHHFSLKKWLKIIIIINLP